MRGRRLNRLYSRNKDQTYLQKSRKDMVMEIKLNVNPWKGQKTPPFCQTLLFSLTMTYAILTPFPSCLINSPGKTYICFQEYVRIYVHTCTHIHTPELGLQDRLLMSWRKLAVEAGLE